MRENSPKFMRDGESFYALLVSVWPVQEFIGEARKLRDLWAGSYLVSRVTFGCIEKIIDKYNDAFRVLYPYIGGAEFYKLKSEGEKISASNVRFPTISNRFLALVDQKHLDEITDEFQKVVGEIWVEEGKKVKEIVGKFVKNDNEFKNWDLKWDSQVNDLFHIMWVTKPVNKETLENNYGEFFDSMDLFLTERKLTRSFTQWEGDEVDKCIQCGNREVVCSLDWSKVRKNREVLFRENEKLCAVCLTKRLMDIGAKRFDSTADVAVAPFREKLKNIMAQGSVNNDVMELIASYKNLINWLGVRNEREIIDRIPGPLFFEENLTPEFIEKEYGKKVGESLLPLGKLKKVEKTICSACKYYAAIFLDGDNVGKILSGNYPASGEWITLSSQRKLSESFSSLASEGFPEVIEKRVGGFIVYCGGDDLLCFMPLEGIMEVLSELRKKFLAELSGTTTVSAGVVVAHYRDPLQLVLADGRKAVEGAKEWYSRDAISFVFRVSSGARMHFGYKWEVKDGVLVTDLIGTVSRWLWDSSLGLSPSFIREMLTLMPAFYEGTWRGEDFHGDMFLLEAGRLIERHTPEGSPLRNRRMAEKTLNLLAEIGSNDSSRTHWKNKNYDGQLNLSSFFRVAGFLAREMRKGR